MNFVAFFVEKPSEQFSQSGIVVEQQDPRPDHGNRSGAGNKYGSPHRFRPLDCWKRSPGDEPRTVIPKPALPAPQG